MAQTKSSAERMRRLRERKVAGIIMVPHIQITRPGIEALIARGLLDAEEADDPAAVRSGLVKLLNQTLTPPPAQPFRQALKVTSFGLL
jgi:hypothetical protein